MDCKEINMSVIIPVYNVEEYLPECLDSLSSQGDIRLEIIIVDDGSTDRSGAIADQYALRDSRIKVIHRANGGSSAARNAGLEAAQGEYIAFLDSDDRLKENSLCDLYKSAIQHQADVVMGQVLYCRQDDSIMKSSNHIHKDYLNKPLAGKDCFTMLIQTDYYLSMVFAYKYRRKYLETIHARFEEGIVHEDELWTPLILCQVERMVIVDLEFYYYRIHDKSITNATDYYRRVYSICRVADKLFEFVDQHIFFGEDRDLKSWFCANIFRLYYYIFELVPKIKDTSIELPNHQLDCLEKYSSDMTPEPLKRCHFYISTSKNYLKEYDNWKNAEWVMTNNPPKISCLCDP